MPEQTIQQFAGINNKANPESLQSGWISPVKDSLPAELTAGSNIDITDRREIRSRTGTTLQVAGSPTSLWSDGEVAFYVDGGVLKRLWPDMTTTSIRSGVGADVVFQRVDDRVYWTDGTLTGVIDNGLNRSWGLNPPLIAGLTSSGSGLLLAGRYQVVLTAMRPNGVESGTSLPDTIDLADNSSITVTWLDSGDTEISHINIYVSNRDGEALFLAGTAPVGDESFTHSGAPLSVPLNLQWLQKPPAGQWLTFYKGRILIASGEEIYVTSTHSLEHVDLREYIACDGSRINMLASLESVVFIGTEEGVSVLQGDAQGSLKATRASIGRVVPGTAVIADGYELFGRIELAGQNVVVFVSVEGVLAGFADGTLVNLTSDSYDVTARRKGAALFRGTSDVHQYIVVQQQ